MSSVLLDKLYQTYIYSLIIDQKLTTTTSVTFNSTVKINTVVKESSITLIGQLLA